MDGVVVTIPGYQEITQLVRILPSPPTWIGTKRGHPKPQRFDDAARLEKRLDFRCATPNTTRADFMVCDDSKHYPSRPTCNFFAARFTGARFRFAGSQDWSSDSGLFITSVRRYFVAFRKKSGQGGSQGRCPGSTGRTCDGSPTGNLRQRRTNCRHGAREPRPPVVQRDR
jgi:hypothetical protein